MQFKVCKCFTIQGQAYEPEGGTNAEALNVFEGSPNHVSTLKAGGYICEMEDGIGYVSDPDKSLASGLVEDTVDGYSEQGVSDGSQLDAEGNPIAAGNKITTHYDETGAVVNSRDDEKVQLPLDECGEQLNASSRLVRYDAGLIRLPTIASPDTCTPEDPKRLDGFYFQPDSHGGGWEWRGKSPWVRSLKTPYRKTLVGSLVAANWNFQDVVNDQVMATSDVVLDNPTCDVIVFNMEFSSHADFFLPDDESRNDSGYWVIWDGNVGGVIHHTMGTRTQGVSYYDLMNGNILTRAEMYVSVPPKSSVTKKIEIWAKNPFLNSDMLGNISNMVAYWRATGAVEI